MDDAGAGWHADLPAAVQLPIAWGGFIAGITLLAGFFTRTAAAACAALVAVETLAVYGTGGLSLRHAGVELSFILFVVSLVILLLGGGAFSLDRLFRNWRRRPRPVEESQRAASP
jgi:uncharacterized membrane protein YphA (DoxX/SURF4 family)